MSSVDFSHVTFISAGAGSGKTYRLTGDLEKALVDEGIHPARVIGTTFTVKAAGELKERVRGRLIASGRLQLAEQMAQALIGTVHSVCERLLKRFSFELGLSPELNVMSVEDGKRLFNQALDEVLEAQQVRELNQLAHRLGQDDWQAEVRKVADKVRENDLQADALPAMAADSVAALLAHFPAAGDRDLTSVLQRTVDEARRLVDVSYDATQNTRTYLRLLDQAHHELQRERAPWSTWIALAATGTGKKSREAVAPVQQAAAGYEAHPQFHLDLENYIKGVMTIAGRAIVRFQILKRDRGLIDFLDMEQLMLRALDDPLIQVRLGEELELLLVDEFQDTNPMQLALFVKLATLADRVIFVGDVKQAIYAFRGCDPDLVFKTLEGMAGAAAATDKLAYSWRSRPGLVHYVNEVFGAAFADDGMEREQVALTPKREELVEHPAVLGWTLAGNRGRRAEGLAEGIAALVRAGHRIVDPDSGQPRSLRWGDVAVLARTNDHVEEIARTLKNRRVPMKMTLSGLLATPEVILARACLRRLNDATDTLATAEILSLAESAEPEAWLTERLGWLSAGNESIRWAEQDHPVVARLAALRRDSAFRSPVEIVARVLNDVGTRFIATGWGPDAVKAAQRQRNLDAFLDLAVCYEDHCASQHLAASLTGFLFWLENPSSPELDLQPMVTSGDAVHVLTYHRAKGLEWPVVIATDFEAADRSSVFDVRVNLTGEFDVSAPLANRTIRFWPNIYGARTRNLPALNRIQDSAEGRDCRQKSESEQRRLAYVGITRARDSLVVALPPAVKADTWLACFDRGLAVPTDDELVLPGGERISTASTNLDGSGEQQAPAPFAPRWFARRERRDDHLKESLNPSYAPPLDEALIAQTELLGERLPLRGDDMTAIGSALHAVIAAELVNPDRPDARQMAAELLQAYGVQGFLDAGDALIAARRLRAILKDRYGASKVVAECPVRQVLDDGRVVRGFIDLLVETGAGPVVIDHKSSPRPRSEWAAEVVEHGGQLRVYRSAVEAASGGSVRVALHFPISGGLVEVALPVEG
jgi:ATP-dependent exoDNAse (exonuclease V) beta subunit